MSPGWTFRTRLEVFGQILIGCKGTLLNLGTEADHTIHRVFMSSAKQKMLWVAAAAISATVTNNQTRRDRAIGQLISQSMRIKLLSSKLDFCRVISYGPEFTAGPDTFN